MASEELLQRRLTRARLALAALGIVAAVCVIAVGVTIWYWLSYLRGPSATPFTRGPYLLRVSGSEATLRWRVRGDKPVQLTAVAPDGAPVEVAGGVMRGLRHDTRYAWTASVDGTAYASGSFTTPPRTLDRTVRFAVLADYGSGNDDEWAVGRVLAAQRPEFAVTAGDNSYLVAAEPLLDRNIFRPLGDLMGSAPLYVCLGDHDNFWPGPGRDQQRVRHPEGRSLRRSLRSDPDRHPRRPAERTGRSRLRPQRAPRAGPGRALRRLPPPTALRRCPAGGRAGGRALPRSSAAICTVTSAASWTGFTRSRSAPAGKGPGSPSRTKRTPGAIVSLLDIGALMLEVRPGGELGYTYLDKHGSVLDHGAF